MSTQTSGTISIYEALRARPAAAPRLVACGITREHLELSIGDAARAAHVPLEALTRALDEAQ